MHEILTSNQVTGIYGQAPTTQKKLEAELTRGFIVYLEMHGLNGKGGIFARTFYTDFKNVNPDGHFNNQTEFEDAVIAAGNAGKLYDVDTGGKWPKAWNDRINEIQFGWTSCNISYILNSDFASFIEVPDDLHGDIKCEDLGEGVDCDSKEGKEALEAEIFARDLVQPIIFRRNKIIVEGNRARVDHYRPNHTFFNLKVEGDRSRCSILRFDNLMLLDADGEKKLGPEPKEQPEAERPYYRYCMDAHIVVSQQRKRDLDKIRSAEDVKAALLVDASSIENGIVIVFDPPQGNGGSGGPPDYP